MSRRRERRGKDAADHEVGFLRDNWIGTLYRLRGTPHIKLEGIRPDADAIYDGEMLRALGRWWSQYLDARPALEEIGHFRRLEGQIEAIQGSVPDANRGLLVAMANSLAPFGRLSEATFGLGYCMARTFMVAGGIEPRPGDELTALSAEDLRERLVIPYTIGERLVIPYTTVADDCGYWPGWWKRQETESIVWAWAIRALRWSHAERASRWEAAYGRRMGSGVGFDISHDVRSTESGRGGTRFVDLLFEYGARFSDAELRE